MAKNSLIEGPASPVVTPNLNFDGSGRTVNGEAGYQKRSKTQSRLDTTTRVLGSRLQKPTKK